MVVKKPFVKTTVYAIRQVIILCKMLTMSILLFTVIDPSGQVRNLAYSADKLESGFEFISGIVKKGTTVLEIKLFDGKHYTALPPEAFDGSPFINTMRRLEKEWQCLLSL